MALPEVVAKALEAAKTRVSWRGFDKEALNKAIGKFVEQIDVVKLHYLENCVGCAVCEPACPFYLVSDHYSPVNKAELARRIYRKKLTIAGFLLGPLVEAKLPKDEKDVAEIVEAAYHCTNCGRCYLSCPFGIDSGALVHGLLRIVASGLGRSVLALETLAELERTGGFVEVKGFVDVWNSMIAEVEKVTGKRPAFDKKGSEVLLLPFISDAVFTPTAVAYTAKILDAAGVDYTLPSMPYGVRPPLGYVVGRYEMIKEALSRVALKAEELGVKKVVVVDGGYPYYWLRWELPKYLGRRPRFKVLHVLEVVKELMEEGKLSFTTTEELVTWHDPCHLGRRSGLTREPYEVLEKVAPRFRKLKHHGAEATCCVAECSFGRLSLKSIERIASLLGVAPEQLVSSDEERKFIEEVEKSWSKAVKEKVEEVRVSGASVVVTACPSCIESLRDAFALYKLDVKVVHLAEFLGALVKG